MARCQIMEPADEGVFDGNLTRVCAHQAPSERERRRDPKLALRRQNKQGITQKDSHHLDISTSNRQIDSHLRKRDSVSVVPQLQSFPHGFRMASA